MIGHGARSHSHLFKALRKGFDLDSAVKKAVICVEVKMYEVPALHSAKLSGISQPTESEVIRDHTISRGVGESTKQHIEPALFSI
jgi:hypothetical protein